MWRDVGWRQVTHYLSEIDIIVLDCPGNLSTLQDLVRGGPNVRHHRDHTFNEAFQVPRIVIWRFLEDTLYNSLVQLIHVCCAKGRVQGESLVENAPQTPYIALAIVWLIIPDFRTSIVRRSCLGVKETCFGYLRDVHVAESGVPLFIQE